MENRSLLVQAVEDMQLRRRLLAGTQPAPQTKSAPQIILEIVQDFWDPPKGWSTAGCRNREYIWPRMVAIWMMRDILGCPVVQLARWFGYRDHGSIVNAEKRVRDEIETNEQSAKILVTVRDKALERIMRL